MTEVNVVDLATDQVIDNSQPLRPTPEPEDDDDDSAQSDHDVSTIELPSQDALAKQAKEQADAKALEEHAANHGRARSGGQKSSTAQDLYVQQCERIIDKAREYQQELFERAKDENVIAVLDTGMGKTLIAAMLIRHTLEQHLIKAADGIPPKNIFFLANRSVVL